MRKEEIILYWLESSERDLVTVEHLFEKGDYTWALFVGHLTVEKVLKACFVKRCKGQPPYTHNLLRLAEKSELDLSEDQKDLLVTITTFNIRTRYDDYKQEFYKTCTKEFAGEWIEKIQGFIQWAKKTQLKLSKDT